MKKVWFITGASQGLGQALADLIRSQGHWVVASSRKQTSLPEETDDFLPLEINLSSEENIRSGVAQAIRKFGRIDVLVNNAGFGQGGAVEEVSDSLARANFEANVFGLLNVTRAILPIFRQQQSGHVMNISSIGGFSGNYSGFGIYCGTKFAVSGITEGLAADLSPLGIHTTLIYPGYFRTNFLTAGSFVQPTSQIEAYQSAKASLDHHKNGINQNQPGDPVKAAQAMFKLSEMPNPPLHLFLGSDALAAAREKLIVLQRALAEQEELSRSTDL